MGFSIYELEVLGKMKHAKLTGAREKEAMALQAMRRASKRQRPASGSRAVARCVPGCEK